MNGDIKHIGSRRSLNTSRKYDQSRRKNDSKKYRHKPHGGIKRTDSVVAQDMVDHWCRNALLRQGSPAVFPRTDFQTGLLPAHGDAFAPRVRFHAE